MSLVRFCKSLWSQDSARKSSRRTARRRFLSEHSYVRSLHLEELEGRRLLATFVVDRTDDVAGATACTAAANDCSLRGAITAANANGTGADTITFDASTNGVPFTLALANAGGANEDANATGDLDVNGSLTITGNGSSNTIIQAGTNTTNGIDKVFAFNPLCTTAMSFSVSGVTIRHGRNTQPFGAADFSYTGGGLDFCGTGASSFSISNSIITNNTNTTAYGGGMNIDEAFPATSTITITNTQFTNNTSLMWGGGLNIFGDNGNTTITGSTFSGNQTLGTGGVGAQGGGINIRVTNQNDGDGAPTPVVSISNSTITSNTGVGFGGGIDVAGASNQDVNISNTAITGNSLIVVAGGVTNTVGGGLDHSNNAARTTTLTNVLIANNQSTGAGGSHGGGVAHGSGNLILRNTTISGNSATGDGGGVYVTVGPSMTLTNTTVSNNRANSDNTGGGAGGGIRKLAGAGTVTLQNTIADGNFTGTGSTADEINGAVNADFSLIGSTTGATITGAANQLNMSGRLAALANNGGQTVGPTGFTAVLQTHALLAGSPALDNGSNALATGASLTTDQRGTGFTRIVDASDADTTDEVDIGALEQHPSVEDLADATINEDNSLSTDFDVGDANLTAGIDTITVTSSNTTLVPNANINVGGTGTNTISNSTNGNHTLVITPVANLFGTTTITITVTDLYNGTNLTMTDTFVLTVDPVADLPSVTNSTTDEDVQTTTGLVVTRNAVDGAEVSHMKITNITNGTLFKNNGTTQINNNDFITFAEANAGLKFTPAANLFSPGTAFSFDVAGATSAAGAGLGPAATATITVNPVADTPSVTNAMTQANIQTTSGLVISRNVVDDVEVTHFKITNITGGTLFQNNGTTQINNGDFITFAQGNAGLKFTPATNFTGTGHFTVQASLSNMDSGLGGSTVTADIVVTGLTLGNLVWGDTNGNGMFDSATETGIDGVLLNLFRDNGTTAGSLDGSDTFITMTTTAGGGLYSFTNIAGDFIVQVDKTNFQAASALEGRLSSPGTAADPDNDVNNDDNGVNDADPAANGIASLAITLASNTEPTTDGDADDDTNLTLDFGFVFRTSVTNTNDSGLGSLRFAIDRSNEQQGVQTIDFAIPGAGVHTIQPMTALPDNTDAVIIDGTTQAGFAVGAPVIELDGINAGMNALGLKIKGGGSTVKGLVINRFNAAGIRLVDGGNNVITGNFIGTDSTGLLDRGNAAMGVQIISSASNTVGGTTAAERNVISGNDQFGVSISGVTSTGNVVQGNYIGTKANGTEALGNAFSGVVVLSGSNTIGGTTAAARNIISGNLHHGVWLTSSTSNLVQGNYIGTDVNGTADLGNTQNGVRIDGSADSNTIGGTSAGARNVISGNDQNGVHLLGFGSTGNLVQGNFIGTKANGTEALGNSQSGVWIQATTTTIGGSAAGAGNVISGNLQHGVLLQGGINVQNLVQGNFIGTDVNGTGAVGNTLSGIQVLHSSSNTIGGTTAAARNVISGNSQNGVHLLNSGTTSTLVQGNYIGTDVNGTMDLGNAGNGVLVQSSASNTVGGVAAGVQNLISGNNRFGIEITGPITTGNLVQGNLIGTKANGTEALGNAFSGVVVLAGSNTIGGNTAAARNIISGNLHHGVWLTSSGATGNLVQSNYIGTDVNGTADLGNTQNGVRIDGSAASNTIGGTASGERNVISGNNQNGLHLLGFAATTGNLVQGNFIGTKANGTEALGNSMSGVWVQAAMNTIGGTAAGAGNVISGNLQHGVLLQGGVNVQNVVQGNMIGSDMNGTAAVANTLSGVQVSHSSGNTIGGTTAAARNVISGNVQNGVHLLNSGTTSNLVQGNYIGTDVNGTADLGNIGDGVLVQSSASNTIGGTAAGALNVISGNNRFGIEITDATSTGNVVQGNFIGTKVNGTETLGNSFSGVAVLAGSNTIGGASVAARNVISGNLHNGVWLTTSAATGNLVQGNFIGTDSTGAADLGNAQIGVKVDGMASSNTIGGTAAVAGNVISGNDQHGVVLLSPGVAGNLVQGNLIGTDAGGTANVGNTLRGVWIANASSNTVGGSTAGASNTVAFNGGSGVLVSGLGTGNAIQQNSMFSNAGLGIDLGPEGINPNDAASGNEDADAGVNNLQNFPVIAAAVLSGMNLSVTYSVPSATANSAYPLTVEFYLADAAGQEGRTFLGSDSYAAGSATMSTMATVPAGSAALGNTIVATATDANGNTSEFSAGATVAAPLMAAENRGSNESPGLEEEQLGSIVEAAIARFVASGLSDQELAALSAVSFAIADLPGATLGLSNGHMITLDINAAGYGWFFDPTPLVDEEFLAGDSFGLQSRPEFPAAQQMDLLSAVMHELGHVLGYDDHYSASHLDDVMSAILQPGIRRTTGFDAADAVFSDGLWADG